MQLKQFMLDSAMLCDGLDDHRGSLDQRLADFAIGTSWQVMRSDSFGRNPLDVQRKVEPAGLSCNHTGETALS